MSFNLNARDARSDVVVIGAGVVGLSLALELKSRGRSVAVVEARREMRQASWAAAGMLAVDDPHNPKELLPLARLSASLYAEFLLRVEELSGEPVPFQTERVVEYLDGGEVRRRAELSLDPRQLAVGLTAAVHASGVELRGSDVDAGSALVVHTTGAWFGGGAVRPRKGQMMRVRMPVGASLAEVHRREDVYIVPRTKGPQAGTALIGATVEDVGFDVATNVVDLSRLRVLAAELVPAFGDESHTPIVESWAGLRPGTLDGLPLIGALPGRPREFVATGHFRNGILLAPATAVVVADLIEGAVGRVDLGAFAPGRFAER